MSCRLDKDTAIADGTELPEEPNSDDMKPDPMWLVFERLGPFGTNEDGFKIDLADSDDAVVHARKYGVQCQIDQVQRPLTFFVMNAANQWSAPGGRRAIQQANEAARSTSNAVGTGLSASMGKLAEEMSVQNDVLMMKEYGATLRTSYMIAKDMDDEEEMASIKQELSK